jgi:MoaA/NifB/PqqE/SkfB family radical SAM enzyme
LYLLTAVRESEFVGIELDIKFEGKKKQKKKRIVECNFFLTAYNIHSFAEVIRYVLYINSIFRWFKFSFVPPTNYRNNMHGGEKTNKNDLELTVIVFNE